jgi:uncharacterized spore protein YtfJ
VDEDEDAKGAVMSNGLEDVMEHVRQEAEARARALQRLLAGSDSSRVFGPPVSSGEYTVIPAAEIASMGGLGSGMGFGTPGRRRTGEEQAPAAWGDTEQEDVSRSAVKGGGGGGGGGGGAKGRPVAAIVIGPDGVAIKPVIDLTKLALTALGAMTIVAAFSTRMWRKR